MPMKLSLIVPMYNEAAIIETTARTYQEYLAAQFPDYELLFVDDGSVTVRPVLNVGVTLDERIADGYYYSKTMMLVKYLLAHPELLELPPK